MIMTQPSVVEDTHDFSLVLVTNLPAFSKVALCRRRFRFTREVSNVAGTASSFGHQRG
jgi:hypothetical protein